MRRSLIRTGWIFIFSSVAFFGMSIVVEMPHIFTSLDLIFLALALVFVLTLSNDARHFMRYAFNLIKKTPNITLFLFLILAGVMAIFPLTYSFFAAQGKLHIYLLLQKCITIALIMGSLALLPIIRKSRKLPVTINNRAVWLVLGIIIVWAGLLRFVNLGSFPIYHDEIWYASAIKSFITAGSTNLWNYVTLQPTNTTYPWLITVVVGSFVKMIGIYNEFVLRIPFAIFSLICIPLIYLLAVKVTNSRLTGLFAAYALAVADIPVYLGRFIRQYSLLDMLTLLLAIGMVTSLKKTRLTGRWNILQVAWPLVYVYIIAALISPFSYSFFPVVGLYIVLLLLVSNSRYKWHTLGLLAIIMVLYVFFELAGLIRIIDLRRLLHERLIIDFSLFRNKDYFDWLFSFLRLPPLFTFIGCVLGTLLLLLDKRVERLLIPLFCWIPFSLLLLNSYHSHDFRYLSYILPFAIILTMLTARNILFACLPRIDSRWFWAIFIFGAIVVTYLAKPSIPGITIPYITVKAQADWQGDDAKRLHRRAVAPNYRMVFSWLNQNVRDGDIVVIVDGGNYIEPKNNVSYFDIHPWNGEQTIVNLRSGESENFFKIVNTLRSGEALFFTGAYMHYLHQDIIAFLDQNCLNHSPDLGVNMFNYNSFYTDKSLYWPNVFECSF